MYLFNKEKEKKSKINAKNIKKEEKVSTNENIKKETKKLDLINSNVRELTKKTENKVKGVAKTTERKLKSVVRKTETKIKETTTKTIENIKRQHSNELYSYKINISKEIDNKNMPELCKGLYEYVPLIKRINKEKSFKGLMFHPHQTCFEINIKKNLINFNLHTKNNPITLENLYKRYYPSCYLTKIDDIEMATENDLVIEYNLQEHYFKSLSIDYSELQPIASFMDLQLALEEDEFVLYQVILTAADPDWGETAEQAKIDFKDSEQSILKMPKNLNIGSIAKLGFNCVGYCVTEFLNGATELIFDDPELIELKKTKNIKFSNATLQKSKYIGFQTTIRVVIHAKDNFRKEVLSHMINNSLTFMDADNQLEPVTMDKKKKAIYSENKRDFIQRVNDRQPSSQEFHKNILNVKEVGKLIMLPTKSLQEKFFMDKNVTVTNTNTLDDEIFEGMVRIGLLVGDAKKRMTAYPINPELYCLFKIAVGGMGSGKSNFTIGYVNDSIKMGNTVFQFDYIDECQIATETKKSNPDHLVIKPAEMLNFSYPELDSQNITEEKKALDFSNCIVDLIDTLNIGNMNDMTGRMKKTLRSSSILCYLTGYRNVKYVYKVLTEIDFREELLDKLNEEQLERFAMYVSTLENLTITKKNAVVNDDDSIKYLLDRFDALMGDGNLMDMFFNETSPINFEELLNSKKLVTIELPQNEYRHKWVKDVIVCFLLHRIWIAAENRPLEERTIVDIILDEVHQLSNTKDFLSTFATEVRKFRISFLFCCQYFNQFKALLENVEGASAHYILLQGAKPSNFTHIEPMVKDFTLENFMDLPKHHSLNLVLTKQGYQSFVTHLPKHY